MKIRSIKSKIKRFQYFTAASAPMHLGLCFPWMRGFMKMQKHYRHYYQEIIMTSKNGIGYQWNNKRQNFLNIKQLYDQPARTQRLIAKWQKQKNNFFNYWGKQTQALKNLGNPALSKIYVKYLDQLSSLWSLPLATDLMGEYTEEKIFPEFSKILPKQYKNSAAELFAFFCRPALPSFIAREHLAILQLALLRKRGSAEYEKCLLKHQRSYFWIENNYKDVKILDASYFNKKVLAETKKSGLQLRSDIHRLTQDHQKANAAKIKLAKKLRLPPGLYNTLLFTADLGRWLDERKEMNLKSSHYLNLFYEKFAKRFHCTLEDSYYFIPNELKNVPLGRKTVSIKKIRSRKKRIFYLIEQPGKEFIYFGKTANQLAKILETANWHPEKTNTIRGFAASKGKKASYQGKARIVLDPNTERFRKGEILIASQTRPEYVPLMRKALCIITDEGGITSHAAVVSREMGIPCIIGAKTATKVFKNGDTVKVDVKNGIIKKLA